MIPQHREEPLYQRELFRLASADCLRPGGVELTERGLTHCAFGVGERVADLGCGPGVTLALLAERGLSPVGMDRSAAMLQEAERRLYCTRLWDLKSRMQGGYGSGDIHCIR